MKRGSDCERARRATHLEFTPELILFGYVQFSVSTCIPSALKEFMFLNCSLFTSGISSF